MFNSADEHSFATERHEVRYLLKKGRGRHLMVAFSVFDAIDRQRYNYIRQLEGAAPRVRSRPPRGPRLLLPRQGSRPVCLPRR
jgi:hypothetical protein